MPHDKICKECQEPFKSKRSDAKYCSPRCRVNYHRREKEQIKTCLNCGEIFIRTRRSPIRNYCSIECKENARRANINTSYRNFYRKHKKLIQEKTMGSQTVTGEEKSYLNLKNKKISREERKKIEMQEIIKVRKMKEAIFKPKTRYHKHREEDIKEFLRK